MTTPFTFAKRAEYPFLPVTGYQDPYKEALAADAANVSAKEAAELNPKPLYTPEEIAKRVAANKLQLLQGQIGMLANDKSLTPIAEPLLKRALEQQQPQLREHGVYDENTGSFRFFPGYQEARKTEAARRQQEITINRAAASRSAYDIAAMRENENSNLRQTLLAMKPPTEQGSLSHVGADKDGMPILMHSKQGLMQMDAEGRLHRFLGPVPPKLAEVPAAMQMDYIKNRAGYSQVSDALKAVEDNPDAVGAVAYLPGAVAQYVPTQGGEGGVAVRAMVGDLGSLKIHDRSGQAVSAKEFPRLRPFIPDVKADSPHTIIEKLKLFKKTYERAMLLIEQGYPLSRMLANTKMKEFGEDESQNATPGSAQQLSDDELINRSLPPR